MKAVVGACAIGLCIACSSGDDLFPIPNPVRVQLAQPSVAPSAWMRFTVTNEGSDAARVSNCGPSISRAIERMQGGEWVEAGAAICQAVNDQSGVLLQPGQLKSDSLLLTQPGQYRFTISYSYGEARILYLAHSPAFAVQ